MTKAKKQPEQKKEEPSDVFGQKVGDFSEMTVEDKDSAGKRKQAKVSDSDAFMPSAEERKPDSEDLLADVRRSLLSEEELENQESESKGFFARFKKKSPKSPDVESASMGPDDEIDVSQEEQVVEVEKQEPKETTRISRRQREEIESFFSDLEVIASDVDYEALDRYVPEKGEVEKLDQLDVDEEFEEEPIVEEETVEAVESEAPAPKVTTLKSIPDSPASLDEDAINIRDLALEDYDETPLEPASESRIPVEEMVRETVRDFKPVERILLGVVFVITIGAMLFAAVYIFTGLVPEPTPTVTPVPSDIPYPVRVGLPGGWRFDLYKGRVVEGKWDPQGAEWLEGTEISRWVALPWSEQLEAVLRTFKRNDQIELTMSNYDILTYNVYSIQEMSFEDLQAQDIRTPNLLLILPQKDNPDDLFWVITALP